MSDTSKVPPKQAHMLNFEGSQIADISIGSIASRDIVNQQFTIKIGARPTPALHHLRAPAVDFRGRKKELDALRRALTEASSGPVVGIFGMGGVGKTELALLVAEKVRETYPDAQIYVDLGGKHTQPLSPFQALKDIITSFGEHETLPNDLGTLERVYRDLLSRHRTIVIADDVADSEQIQPLLPPSGSTLIITGRERVSLPLSWEIHLHSLDEADACELLRAICRRLNGDEALRIASSCGYLPLALRIAGGLFREDEALDVDTYLNGLAREREGLALAIEDSIALSFNRLPQPVQRTFARLSVFSGSFDWEAALTVLELIDDPAQVRESLRVLNRRSFLERDAGCEQRVRLHNLMRAFGRMQLTNPSEKHGVEHSLVIHYILKSATLKAKGELLDRIEWVRKERENLQEVRSWLWLQPQSGYFDQLIVMEAHSLADLTMFVESREESDRQLEEAIKAAKRLGEMSSAGWFSFQRGWFRLLRGEWRNPASEQVLLALWNDALALARDSADRRLEARVLGHMAELYANRRDWEAALVFAEQALTVTANASDDRARAQALYTFGEYHAAHRKYALAIEHYSEAARLFRASDFLSAILSLISLGNVQRAERRYIDSVESFEQAIKLVRGNELDWLAIDALVGAAIGSEMLCRSAQADKYLSEALELSGSGSEFAQQARGRVFLVQGLAYWDRGDLYRAATCLRLALDAAKAVNNEQVEFSVMNHPEIIEYPQLPHHLRVWLQVRQKWRYFKYCYFIRSGITTASKA